MQKHEETDAIVNEVISILEKWDLTCHEAMQVLAESESRIRVPRAVLFGKVEKLPLKEILRGEEIILHPQENHRQCKDFHSGLR